MISASAALTGSYDYEEVARSVSIAIAASYAALDLDDGKFIAQTYANIFPSTAFDRSEAA